MQKQKIEEDTEECSWRVKRKMRLAHAADSSRRNQHGKFMKIIIRFEAVLFFAGAVIRCMYAISMLGVILEVRDMHGP